MQRRAETAWTFCCSGGGPRQPWSSGLAPVSRLHSSSPLFPLVPVPLTGLLASVNVKQQYSLSLSLPPFFFLSQKREREGEKGEGPPWRCQTRTWFCDVLTGRAEKWSAYLAWMMYTFNDVWENQRVTGDLSISVSLSVYISPWTPATHYWVTRHQISPPCVAVIVHSGWNHRF